MAIVPSLLTHGIRTGTFTSASTAAINAQSGSKILLAFAYRASDLASVANEVPFVTGAAQYWGPLERRAFDSSTRMHAHLYQGFGEFTNEPINITTFLSRSLDGLYWAAIEVSSSGTPYVIRTSNNLAPGNVRSVTASFLEPYQESTNTVIGMAISDLFGNAIWTASANFPNVLLSTASSQYSAHIAYSTASVTSPEVGMNFVEAVLFGAEIKEITYTPTIQGQYLKRQQPTASAVNHFDTIDITSGTNRTLAAAVTMNQSATVTTMSFNGTALNLLSNITSSVGDYRVQSWWYDIPDELPEGTYPVTMSATAARTGYTAHWYQMTNAARNGPVQAQNKTDSVGITGLRGLNITGSLNSFGIGAVNTNRTASSYIFNGILENSIQSSGSAGNHTEGSMYGYVWSDNIMKIQNLFSTTVPFQLTNVMLFAPSPTLPSQYNAIFGQSGQNLFSITSNSNQGSLVYITGTP